MPSGGNSRLCSVSLSLSLLVSLVNQTGTYNFCVFVPTLLCILCRSSSSRFLSAGSLYLYYFASVSLTRSLFPFCLSFSLSLFLSVRHLCVPGFLGVLLLSLFAPLSSEKELLPFLSLPQKPFFQISERYPPLVEARAEVEKVLRDCLVEAEEYLSVFEAFHFLSESTHPNNAKPTAASTRKKELSDFFAPLDLNGIRDALSLYHNAIYEVQAVCPREIHTRLITLDCAQAKTTLVQYAKDLWYDSCRRVDVYLSDLIQEVVAGWTELHERVLTIPTTETELAELKDLLSKISDFTEPLTLKTKLIHELIDLLSSFNYAIKKSMHEEAFRTYSWPLQIKFDLVETTGILEQGRLRVKTPHTQTANKDQGRSLLASTLTPCLQRYPPSVY